jgi:hypothetical protein
MNKLRGKRVLVTVPELKKSPVELSTKDEEMIMMEAMKKWQSLEIYEVGDDVVDLKPGDKVYVQTYALESGEKIEVDGHMRILIPDTAVAIVW